MNRRKWSELVELIILRQSSHLLVNAFLWKWVCNYAITASVSRENASFCEFARRARIWNVRYPIIFSFVQQKRTKIAEEHFDGYELAFPTFVRLSVTIWTKLFYFDSLIFHSVSKTRQIPKAGLRLYTRCAEDVASHSDLFRASETHFKNLNSPELARGRALT